MKRAKFTAAAMALAVAYGAAGAALAAAGTSGHYTGEKYANEAKISLDQARTIATKAVKGHITDQELEKERGGSGLRYSFDVRRGKATHEVGVDAKTGKVLENSIEGPDAD